MGGGRREEGAGVAASSYLCLGVTIYTIFLQDTLFWNLQRLSFSLCRYDGCAGGGIHEVSMSLPTMADQCLEPTALEHAGRTEGGKNSLDEVGRLAPDAAFVSMKDEFLPDAFLKLSLFRGSTEYGGSREGKA